MTITADHYLRATEHSMLSWLGLESSARSSQSLQWDDIDYKDLTDGLYCVIDRSERMKRLLLTDVLNAIPYPIYRRVTDFLKKKRGSKRIQRVIHIEPGLHVRLASQLATNVGAGYGPLKVFLTHDIDTSRCAKFWPKLVELEKKYGVRSAFNVLTAGPYPLDMGWLDELEAAGFEIGLHGDYHDLALGFRSPAVIAKRISRCLDDLGRQVVGFRSPGLAVSSELLDVLDKLGFRYDSSIRFRAFYAQGVDTAIPYVYPNSRIWELPLAIQDDGLFRDVQLSDSDALDLIQDLGARLRKHYGLLVINLHPMLVEEHLDFFEGLLRFLSLTPEIEVVLGKHIVSELDRQIPRSVWNR